MANASQLRSAFTLVELLLVLGVLVVVASLSWPRLMRYVEENSLRQNVELVRRELANTRVLAIESGLTYQFRFEPNARDFVILPLDYPEVSTAGASGKYERDPQPPKVKTIVGHLAEGIVFEPPESEIGVSAGGQRLEQKWLALLKNGALYTETVWSAPVLFRPNGSSQDANLTVKDRSGRSVQFTVRGLTGAVRSGRIKTEGPPP